MIATHENSKIQVRQKFLADFLAALAESKEVVKRNGRLNVATDEDGRTWWPTAGVMFDWTG